MELQQALGISKDSVLVCLSLPSLMTDYRIMRSANIKVLAEVLTRLGGVTAAKKVYLSLGNIIIEL
jgi:hypothetical protein